MRALAAVFAALSACCGEAPDITEFDPSVAVELATMRAAPLGRGECGAAFDPAPELSESTESAASRWRAATGCNVRVEAGGVPVRAQGFLFIEELPSGLVRVHDSDPQLQYHELCGGTFWKPGTLEPSHIIVATLNPRCPVAEAVAHELGHSLAKRRGHSESGLMADTNADGRSALIDAASLEWVCDELDCAVFASEPETPL